MRAWGMCWYRCCGGLHHGRQPAHLWTQPAAVAGFAPDAHCACPRVCTSCHTDLMEGMQQPISENPASSCRKAVRPCTGAGGAGQGRRTAARGLSCCAAVMYCAGVHAVGAAAGGGCKPGDWHGHLHLCGTGEDWMLLSLFLGWAGRAWGLLLVVWCDAHARRSAPRLCVRARVRAGAGKITVERQRMVVVSEHCAHA